MRHIVTSQSCPLPSSGALLRFYNYIVGAALGVVLAMPSCFSQPTYSDCENRANKPKPTALEQEYIKKLAALRQCTGRALEDQTPCNVFLSWGLEKLYNNVDFRTRKDSYMVANDIVNGLEQPGNAGWKKIGTGDSQVALDEAQKHANAGKPVVAARLGKPKEDGHLAAGHVALVLPGTQEMYPPAKRWKELRAPNSASFFWNLDKPVNMYLGCPLSAAFAAPTGVGLYYKP